jgi:hypothetical protein
MLLVYDGAPALNVTEASEKDVSTLVVVRAEMPKNTSSPVAGGFVGGVQFELRLQRSLVAPVQVTLAARRLPIDVAMVMSITLSANAILDAVKFVLFRAWTSILDH